MQDIIKEIRAYLGLSQAEFADKLGVTFATVNRWENGRVLPNKLAQIKLYEFCKEKEVPVYDMTIARVNKEAKELNVPNDRVLLYHGSKKGIVGKIAPISRDKCDFGKGFYMGTDPAQPLTLICDFEKSTFYVVSIKTDNLNTLKVPADIDWAMLVAYHRGRMERINTTEFYDKYSKMDENKDVIIGSIANDKMFYVLDNFFLGNITDLALVKSLSALQLGEQYVAVTEKACDEIKIEKEIEISYMERRFLQDRSEENRAKGVRLANDICKNYRREGKFFDEILDEAK